MFVLFVTFLIKGRIVWLDVSLLTALVASLVSRPVLLLVPSDLPFGAKATPSDCGALVTGLQDLYSLSNWYAFTTSWVIHVTLGEIVL